MAGRYGNWPRPPLEVEYFVVAGGAGGGYGRSGNHQGGGGGAGGVLYGILPTPSLSEFIITVGAGGSTYANGVNSSISGTTDIISSGGGSGGGDVLTATTGFSGGSGGGGAGSGAGTARLGGAGTIGQGTTGGTGYGTSYGGGGGGAIGGSGFYNVDATTSRSGNGGPGLQFPILSNGYSIYFDTTGSLTVPSGSLPGGLNTEFTFELWVYIVDLSATRTITKVTSGFDLYVQSAGNVKVDRGGTNTIINTANNLIRTFTWHHIAVTRTVANLYSLYIDGRFISSGSLGTSLSASTTIGNSNFYGFMSNIRHCSSVIYTSDFVPSIQPLAAVPSTVLLTAQNSTLIDNSENNFSIVSAGTANSVQTGPFNFDQSAAYSTHFIGNSYLTINNVGDKLTFGTGPFTIEAWIFPTTSSSAMQVCWIYGNTIDIISIAVNTGTGAVTFTLRGTNLAQTIITHNSGSAMLRRWSHVAIVRDGTNFYGCVNGIVNSTTISASGAFNETQAQFFSQPRIGAKSNTDGNYFAGFISNWRAIKGTALYTSNFTPSKQSLTPVNGTSVLTCQSLSIVDNSDNNFSLTQTGTTVPAISNPFLENTYYAAGGGGAGEINGIGGFGGGGNGGISLPPSSGVINSGSGGGGGTATGSTAGGSGGSGTVIIKYSNKSKALTNVTGSPEISESNGYRIYKWTSSGTMTI